MIEEDGEQATPLAEHWLERLGMRVVLDKGFAEGTYCVYVVYDELARRMGFTASRRLAANYGARLKRQMSRVTDCTLGAIEDASLSDDPRRRRNVEATFLSFPLGTTDGRYRDAAMAEEFGLAFLRTEQEWDQLQARAGTERRLTRQERFRQQLAGLLDGEAYAGVDAATKARLLNDVPELAFRVRETGR